MRILDLQETRGRAQAFYRDAQGTWTFDPLSFEITAPGQLRVNVHQTQRGRPDRPSFVIVRTLVVDRGSQTWSSPRGRQQAVDEQGFPQGPAQQLPAIESRPWSSSRLVQDLIARLVRQRYIEQA